MSGFDKYVDKRVKEANAFRSEEQQKTMTANEVLSEYWKDHIQASQALESLGVVADQVVDGGFSGIIFSLNERELEMKPSPMGIEVGDQLVFLGSTRVLGRERVFEDLSRHLMSFIRVNAVK